MWGLRSIRTSATINFLEESGLHDLTAFPQLGVQLGILGLISRVSSFWNAEMPRAESWLR